MIARSRKASQLASPTALLLLWATLLALPGCGGPPRPARHEPPPSVVEEDAEEPDAPPGATPSAAWDFAHAKRALTRLYLEHGPHLDVYCGCPFDVAEGRGLAVDLAACGYVVLKDPQRAGRIEWEHAVPASVFGRTFTAWTDGDPRCRNGKGKAFHGRTCARRASPEFSRIEADMHNLFPVVGEVNALRSDLPMGRGLLDDPSRPARSPRGARFGACKTAIVDGALSPRPEVRGDLARAYKYMALTYPARAPIDAEHRAVFDAWDAADPPDDWERERSRRIKALQGAPNPFVERAVSSRSAR